MPSTSEPRSVADSPTRIRTALVFLKQKGVDRQSFSLVCTIGLIMLAFCSVRGQSLACQQGGCF